MKKRVVSLLTVAALASAALSVPVLAEEDTAYATREYVVSEFVQSVGRNNLQGNAYTLSTFKDADEVSDEYRNDLEKAASNGLVRGDEGMLRPKDNITRVEALVLLSRCIPETNDLEGEPIEFTDVPDWAKDTIDGLSKAGIVYGYGDGTLGAQDNITVEQVKLLTDRSDELLNTTPVGESFYGYVNNKMFRNAQLTSGSMIDPKHGAIIEADDAWSYMGDMQTNITNRENELLEKLMNDELEYEKGSAEQRIHDMLLCIQDSSNTTDEDKNILTEMRNRIINAKSLEDLISVTNEIARTTGIMTLFEINLSLDPETNKVYPYIAVNTGGAGGIINYRKATKDAFSSYYESTIKNAMNSIGFNPSDADIKSAIEIQEAACTDLNYAQLVNIGLILRAMIDPSVTQEKISAEMEKVAAEHPELDPETYTTDKETSKQYTADELNAIVKNVNLSDVLESYGFEKPETLFSNTEDTAKSVAKLINDKNLGALKINALMNLAALQIYLSDEEQDAFKELDYVSTAAMSFIEGDAKPTFDQAQKMIDMLNAMLGDGMIEDDGEDGDDDILSAANQTMLNALLPNDIGLMYCDYYYDDKTSDDIADMVGEIWEEYIETFEKNTWMEDSTKENAIKKIKNMVAVIGYPDNYVFPEITAPEDGGTYFTNYLNIQQNNLNTIIRQCDEENFVREQMLSSPDVVNAFYAPMLNIMNILAGILQYPIYDPEASRAQNLGAIGAVVGHEIGHAFDKDGSQYDENGCLKNWWTEKDMTEYNKRIDNFIEYYKNFSVVDGVVQDSEVTIGENMADFAGMRCVLNILEGDKEAQKEAMESWARCWARLGTEKYVTNSMFMTDVHSANNVRVDGVIASMDEFYDIYDISEGDSMYVAPENRLKLW